MNWGGSADEILATGFITGKIKESGVDILGIVLDADEAFAGRWQRIRGMCVGLFPQIPKEMPRNGLVVENADGMRFGVWFMPDNESRGMLETFLKFLVPNNSAPVMKYADEAMGEAHKRGAPYRECHIDKALIHTWLAWQDPPGQPLGRALTACILDPHCEHATSFVAWFKNLYQL